MKLLSALLMSLLPALAFAQNKTLAVGTPTPNPHAALQVESPTNNQGFIMPRLTTAQRTATGFTSILTTTDNGLMVYDTDEKSIYIWDGSVWRSSQQVAQANLALQANEAALANEAEKLVLPYEETTVTMPNNSNIISVVHNGTGVENVGVAKFENLNPDNGYNPLYVRNFGLNGAAYFQVSNPGSLSSGLRSFTNSDQANAHAVSATSTGVGGSGGIFGVNNALSLRAGLIGQTNGIGPAGMLISSNATSSAPALVITNAGTGNAIEADRPIQAPQFIGDGSLLTNLPGGGFSLPYSQSTSSASNLFDLTNSGSGAVIRTSTSGSGHTIHSTTSGTGAAGYFENTNATNSFRILVGATNGTGGAGGFMINNVANSNTALTADTNGAGLAFGATTTGTSTAGQFDINNSSNSAPALKAQTDGNGNGLLVNVTKVGNTQPAISITHAGTGNAITANRPIQATSFIGDGSSLTGVGSLTLPYSSSDNVSSGASFALTKYTNDGAVGAFYNNGGSNLSPTLDVETNGEGRAGQFIITNGVNAEAAVYGQTNGTGAAIYAAQTNYKNAIEIAQGGMKLSVITVSVGGTITQLASIYRITTLSAVTLPTATDGQICIVDNNAGAAISLTGLSAPGPGTFSIYIYLGGWRPLQI